MEFTVTVETCSNEARIRFRAETADSAPDPTDVYLDVDDAISLLESLATAISEVARNRWRRS